MSFKLFDLVQAQERKSLGELLTLSEEGEIAKTEVPPHEQLLQKILDEKREQVRKLNEIQLGEK